MAEKIYGLKIVASKIREQLKSEFPNCVFSVTKDSLSIDIRLMSADFDPFVNEDDRKRGYLSINKFYIDRDDRLTDKGKEVLKRAKEISDQYNWDKSDPMTDYFDVNFYLHLSVGNSRTDKPFELKSSKPSKPSRPNSSQDELVYEFKGWKMFKKIVKGKVLFVVVKNKETPANKEQWAEIKSDVYLQTGFKWNFGNFSKWEKLPDGVFAKFEEIFAKYYPQQEQVPQPSPQQEEAPKPQPLYGENQPNRPQIGDDWLKELTKTYSKPSDVLFKTERLTILNELEARLESTYEDFKKDTNKYLKNNVNFLFTNINSGESELNLLEGLAPMNFSNETQTRISYRELLDRILEIGGFSGRLDAIYGVEVTVDGEANTEYDKKREEELSIEENRPVRYENIFCGGLLRYMTWYGLHSAVNIAKNFLNDEFKCSFKYPDFTDKFKKAFTGAEVELKDEDGKLENLQFYVRKLGDKFVYLIGKSYFGLYSNSFSVGLSLMYKLKDAKEGLLEYVKDIDPFGYGLTGAEEYLPQLEEKFPDIFPKPQKPTSDKEVLEKQTSALSMLLDYGGDTLTQEEKNTLERQISALKTLINLI